jgi:hypothetical protein
MQFPHMLGQPSMTAFTILDIDASKCSERPFSARYVEKSKAVMLPFFASAQRMSISEVKSAQAGIRKSSKRDSFATGENKLISASDKLPEFQGCSLRQRASTQPIELNR